MNAELAARLTVARSAAGDFERETAAFAAGGPSPDYPVWAYRLDGALRGVFGTAGHGARSERPDSPASGAPMLTPRDRRSILAALDHTAAFLTERAATYCLDCAESPAGLCDYHADDLDQASACRALADRLKEDQ